MFKFKKGEKVICIENDPKMRSNDDFNCYIKKGDIYTISIKPFPHPIMKEHIVLGLEETGECVWLARSFSPIKTIIESKKFANKLIKKLEKEINEELK